MGFTVVTVGLHSESSELASVLAFMLVRLLSEPAFKPTFSPSSLASQLAQLLETMWLWVKGPKNGDPGEYR